MPEAAGIETSPHLAYCGGSFGRVSLMTADSRLADHARDCVQLLVNVHSTDLAVRIQGIRHELRPFDAMVIRSRETYAIPGQQRMAGPRDTPGFLLVKTDLLQRSTAGRAQAAAVESRPLRGSARDDAAQLVDELLQPTPEARAVERGVDALQTFLAPAFDTASRTGVPRGLEESIRREAESIELEDLAEFGVLRRAGAYGISERHFLTLFRRATSLPPRAFYNMRRLEAAFALLGDATRTIADISYSLGFSAPPHFTRFMRSNTGWTPSAYRTRVQHLPAPLRPRWDRSAAALA